MFKQTVVGFRGKTLPFTIIVGLFLFTVSFCETMSGRQGSGIWSYIIAWALLLTVVSVILMLAFVSYEYRLMYNCLIIRRVAFGKTCKALTIMLDDKNLEISRVRPVRALGCSNRMFLPFYNYNRLFRLTHCTSKGKRKRMAFAPSEELVDMIKAYHHDTVLGS